MFFDRLFNLTSLKARLLGGTSFTQLYSAERLPLHKFRREGAMLTPLIAGLLAACGGGGGGVVPIGATTSGGGGDRDDDVTAGRDITITVSKGLVEGAQVYLDRNGNGEAEASELIGTTDSQGKVNYLWQPMKKAKSLLSNSPNGAFDLLPRKNRFDDTSIEYVTEVPADRNNVVASPISTTVQNLRR